MTSKTLERKAAASSSLPDVANNCAIYYHPDAYETKRKELKGRHAAGEAFLQALARFGGVGTMYCYAQTKRQLDHFASKLGDYKKSGGKVAWLPWQNWKALEQVGTLYVPGPDIGQYAWQRRNLNNRAYSLFGVTHTTATNRIMDAIGEYLIAPLQPWDAVVCTSKSVKGMVQNIIDAQADYLKLRLGVKKAIKSQIHLPVIPLGVDCSAFDIPAPEAAKLRLDWRAKLGIEAEDFVALFLGRLSFHAKAHPMPIYRGLEEAARRTGKKIHLIMAGWFQNEAIAKEFANGARLYCPSVKVSFVDGRQPVVRRTIWYAADIFTSLSDNIQETFGLTPVEAMAAGLPVVASDWDGYRETVRSGVDGMLIPTWMASPGSAQDLALSNAMGAVSYDEYIGFQSQFTSVSVKECAEAYVALIDNKELRKSMSVAAKQRAREVFDWPVIIRAYQELWNELSAIRNGKATEVAPISAGAPPIPLRQDPTTLFQGYPSHSLSGSTEIVANSLSNMAALANLKDCVMNTYAAGRVVVESDVDAIFKALESEAQTMDSLKAAVPENRKSAVHLTTLWLAKMGLVDLRSD